jgi:hypothetical protein
MAVEEMKKGYSGDDKEFAADTEIIFSTYLAPESDTKVYVSDMLRDNLQSMVSGEMLATQSEVHRYRTFYSYSNCISMNTPRTYKQVLRYKMLGIYSFPSV